MKNIIFLRNYVKLHVHIMELFNCQKYRFFAICDKVGFNSLELNDEIQYFQETFVLDDFNYIEIKKIIDRIAEEYPADANIPISTRDKSISEVGRYLFENGKENTDLSQYVDKIEMKRRLADIGITLPKYISLPYWKRQNFILSDLQSDMISANLKMPVFVKPTRSSGSTHARRINNNEELECWWNNIKELPDVDFEIDEYIEGTLFHCDTFISNYKFLFTQISRYSSPCADFLFGKPLGSIALDPSSEIYSRLCEFTHRCLIALSPPKSGITHLEVFVTNEEELVFMEVAARPPGAFVPDIYEKFLGVNIDKEHILLRIDENHIPEIKRGSYSAGFIFPKSRGMVEKVNPPTTTSHKNCKIFIKENEIFGLPSDLSQVAAEINIWHDNFKVVEEDFNYLAKFSICEMKNICNSK